MTASVPFASLILPHLTQLTPYQAGKPLEELERELGLTDAIKLASNENPLGPSPLALAAIRDSLGSLHRYPDSHAYYLKEDLARHHGLAPQQLILGNGSDEVLDLLVRALVPPGGEVLSTTHTFLMYGLLTQAVGGFFRPVPLREMRVDLKAMAQAVTPQTRLIILCNPNNPTGTAFSRQELEDFLAAVPATATVVLDEAYIDFADDPQVPSLPGISVGRPPPGGVAHLFQDLWAGGPAHRLRLRPQRIDGLPQPPPDAVQRQPPGPGGRPGGACTTPIFWPEPGSWCSKAKTCSTGNWRASACRLYPARPISCSSGSPG